MSTGRELSFEWPHHRISSTDSQVRVTLQNSIKHSGSERVKPFFVVVVFVVDTDAPPVIVKEETEAGEFVAEINKLRAHGGGDCPEYTFKGMLEALYQDPAWGSPMYVFTDAGPKDATEYDIEEVKALASADEYGVTINFFTTGRIASCRDALMGSSHVPVA